MRTADMGGTPEGLLIILLGCSFLANSVNVCGQGVNTSGTATRSNGDCLRVSQILPPGSQGALRDPLRQEDGDSVADFPNGHRIGLRKNLDPGVWARTSTSYSKLNEFSAKDFCSSRFTNDGTSNCADWLWSYTEFTYSVAQQSGISLASCSADSCLAELCPGTRAQALEECGAAAAIAPRVTATEEFIKGQCQARVICTEVWVNSRVTGHSEIPNRDFLVLCSCTQSAYCDCATYMICVRNGVDPQVLISVPLLLPQKLPQPPKFVKFVVDKTPFGIDPSKKGEVCNSLGDTWFLTKKYTQQQLNKDTTCFSSDWSCLKATFDSAKESASLMCTEDNLQYIDSYVTMSKWYSQQCGAKFQCAFALPDGSAERPKPSLNPDYIYNIIYKGTGGAKYDESACACVQVWDFECEYSFQCKQVDS